MELNRKLDRLDKLLDGIEADLRPRTERPVEIEHAWLVALATGDTSEAARLEAMLPLPADAQPVDEELFAEFQTGEPLPPHDEVFNDDGTLKPEPVQMSAPPVAEPEPPRRRRPFDGDEDVPVV